MIKKDFNKSNLLYGVIILIASIYLVYSEGWSCYFNYASMLLALFLPIFIFVLVYKIIRLALINESIATTDIYRLIIFIVVALATYFLGLEKAQKVFLIVFDAFVCFFLFIIMLYLSIKRKA